MLLVYVLRNRINGKYYVGQTTQPIYKRMRDHRYNKKSLIGKAIRKYGEINFEKTLLECFKEDHQDFLECDLIKRLNSKAPNGYNITDGGEGLKNPTPEIRHKLGNGNRGKVSPKKGVPVSEEQKEKQSIAMMGKPSPMKGKHQTEEAKQKISEHSARLSGPDNPFFGKHHIVEVIQKNREAHLGKPSAMKGQQQSEEAKQKISEANKGNTKRRGKHHTDEAKEKNRLAHLGTIPPNKGIRVPHLCSCGKLVKEKYDSKGAFKGYRKTCGSKKCITTSHTSPLLQ